MPQTLRVHVHSSQALFPLYMAQHKLNTGATGFKSIRFHLSIVVLRTEVDEVEDALVDVAEVAESDMVAMVVTVEDLADAVTMSMVSMFLTLIAALAPMSGTDSNMKEAIVQIEEYGEVEHELGKILPVYSVKSFCSCLISSVRVATTYRDDINDPDTAQTFQVLYQRTGIQGLQLKK